MDIKIKNSRAARYHRGGQSRSARHLISKLVFHYTLQSQGDFADCCLLVSKVTIVMMLFVVACGRGGTGDGGLFLDGWEGKIRGHALIPKPLRPGR